MNCYIGGKIRVNNLGSERLGPLSASASNSARREIHSFDTSQTAHSHLLLLIFRQQIVFRVVWLSLDPQNAWFWLKWPRYIQNGEIVESWRGYLSTILVFCVRFCWISQTPITKLNTKWFFCVPFCAKFLRKLIFCIPFCAKFLRKLIFCIPFCAKFLRKIFFVSRFAQNVHAIYNTKYDYKMEIWYYFNSVP